MVTDHAAFVCYLFIIACNYATFAGGHILGWVKTESTCSKGTNCFSIVFCAVGLACIFYYGKLMVLCNFSYNFHLCRMAVEMHRHDSFCFACDLLRYLFWIKVECLSLYV